MSTNDGNDHHHHLQKNDDNDGTVPSSNNDPTTIELSSIIGQSEMVNDESRPTHHEVEVADDVEDNSYYVDGSHHVAPPATTADDDVVTSTPSPAPQRTTTTTTTTTTTSDARPRFCGDCFPYKNSWMIWTCQIISIIGLFVSFYWYILFIVAFVSTLSLQCCLSCCRFKYRYPLICLSTLCFLCSFLHILAFIYIWFIWSCNNFISIQEFLLLRDNQSADHDNNFRYNNGTIVDGPAMTTAHGDDESAYSSYLQCNYEEWVARAIVGFMTYFLTGSTLMRFVSNGNIEMNYEQELFRIEASHELYRRQQRRNQQLSIELMTASSNQMVVVTPISEADIRRLRRQERHRQRAHDHGRRVPNNILSMLDDIDGNNMVMVNEGGDFDEEETIRTSDSSNEGNDP